MAVGVGIMAQQRGDIKVIHSASGSVAAGAAVVAATSWTQPTLAAGEKLITILQISRSAATATTLSISNTSALAPASGHLGYINLGATYAIRQDEQIRRADSTTAKYMITLASAGLSTGAATDDINADTTGTLYLNIQQQAATTFYYTILVYKIASNVK